MKFIIEVYEKEDGEIPFDYFVSQLNPRMRAKLFRDLDILEAFGNELREPLSKPLRQGIFELRSKVGSDIIRSLYFFFQGRRIIVTNGFVKKDGKTPVAEINKAIEYREDWFRRHGNEV